VANKFAEERNANDYADIDKASFLNFLIQRRYDRAVI
jgi:hypothetical protein